MSLTRQIALRHIRALLCLARENVREDYQQAQRYVEIARKITMRTKIRLPKEYRLWICRCCKSLILPGVNCRVRTQPRREPHLVITCFKCGKHMRIPLRKRGNKQRRQSLSYE